MHELHRKNKSGVIFKINFEKAYDKVKWPFVQQTLRMKGLLLNGVSGYLLLYRGVMWVLKLMIKLVITFKL